MGYQITRRGLLLVYSLLIIVPLAVVLGGSLKDLQSLFASPFSIPTDLRWENYSRALNQGDLGVAFRNSVLLVVCSVPLALLLASLTAHAVARIPGWRGWAVYGVFIAGMAVPAQANMIPQYVLLDQLGLRNSLTGLILIEVVVTLPVAVFILAGFMKTLPRAPSRPRTG